MLKIVLAVLLFLQVGCAEFITYTIVSAGSLTGQIAHTMYNEYIDEKESSPNKPTWKEAKKNEK